MKIKPSIAISENGFVFDPVTGQSYNLNATGLEILRMVVSGRGEDEVVNHFVAEYDITKSQIESDLADFRELLIRFELAENGD